MTQSKRPTVGQAMARGLLGHCPACNEGRIFGRYLKVQPTCEACGQDLAQYPADDGPAYFTILLVGHLIVGPLFFFPIIWETSAWIMLPILMGSLTVSVLLILPRIKGAFIGLLYALGIRERDSALHTAD